MAEETGDMGNGEQAANGADKQPQVGILTQYVKDLSFENPNAPAVYQWQNQPNIDVQLNIGAQMMAEDVHEVTIRFEVTASAQEGTAFKTELLYGGLFLVKNVPEDASQRFLLIEAPRLLFPFARRVIADTVQDGGFPPLMLDPVDFNALYLQRAAQLEAEGGEGQAPEATGQA